MDKLNLIKKLSEIEALESWSSYCIDLQLTERREVFQAAQKLWLQRMAQKGKLLIHPDVLIELETQSWEPNNLQKKMIWASVIALAEGPDSNERFQAIKIKLLKKYGRVWWEDVFKRKNNAFAAKERIKKKTVQSSIAISTLVKNTVLFSGFAAEERDAALRMIPKI